MGLRTSLALVSLLVLSACASHVREPNACVVSTKDGNDPDEVEVTGESAFMGAGCITGRFGCKWKEATFQGDDIVVDGELTDRKGKIASYKDGKFSYEMNQGIIAKAIAGAVQDEPKFDFQKDKVVITTPLKGIAKKIKGSDTSVVTITHAPTCTPRQVALGVGYILAGRKH